MIVFVIDIYLFYLCLFPSPIDNVANFLSYFSSPINPNANRLMNASGDMIIINICGEEVSLLIIIG